MKYQLRDDKVAIAWTLEIANIARRIAEAL